MFKQEHELAIADAPTVSFYFHIWDMASFTNTPVTRSDFPRPNFYMMHQLQDGICLQQRLSHS